MKYIFVNADVYTDKGHEKRDFEIGSPEGGCKIIHSCGTVIFPGFIDVHVHFRQPGFEYKEKIETGSMAAAAGGFTEVCTMPNLMPVPDSLEKLKMQLNIIKNDAVIGVHPYGALTKGEMGTELSDMADMASYAVAFSDDGRGLQSAEMMEQAMQKAKSLGKIVAAHCEDNSLLFGGYIHDGKYAREHEHKGISSKSEYAQIERDIALAKKTGVMYHVCHVSTKQSVELIRRAKADGVNITCETAPHYLTLTEDDLEEDGRFKMNPPLREQSDREALIEGIKDGTIDMIATDHAPHSAEEKSGGLKKSMMGVVGLETAFAVMYTNFVKTGILSMEKLLELMHYNPKKRFCLDGGYETGSAAVFELNRKYKINPARFLSKGRSTPFAGNEVYGKCVMTFYKGEQVYENRF